MIFVISTIFEVSIYKSTLILFLILKIHFFDIWIEPSNTKSLIMYLCINREIQEMTILF